MDANLATKAICPKCGGELLYVTALVHRQAANMRRTTFLCQRCNRTWSYSLSAQMAAAYAAAAPRLVFDAPLSETAISSNSGSC